MLKELFIATVASALLWFAINFTGDAIYKETIKEKLTEVNNQISRLSNIAPEQYYQEEKERLLKQKEGLERQLK